MSANALPANERHIPVEGARLYDRELGQGQPLIALHGGLDLDHHDLPPGMDILADAVRLIFYDQQGRGSSAPEFALLS